MSAQPAEAPGEPQTIRLGGEEAAVIPIADYWRLKAIERHASPQEVAAAEAEEAEIAEVIAEHRAYVDAGAPGAMWHEDFMRELFGEDAR